MQSLHIPYHDLIMAALPPPLCVCVCFLSSEFFLLCPSPCLFCVCACGRGFLPQAAPGESTPLINFLYRFISFRGRLYPGSPVLLPLCPVWLTCVANTSVSVPPHLRLPCLPRSLLFASSLPACGPACLLPALLCFLSVWVRSRDGPHCAVLHHCHCPAADATSRHLLTPSHSTVTSRTTFGSWDFAPPLPLAPVCTFEH